MDTFHDIVVFHCLRNVIFWYSLMLIPTGPQLLIFLIFLKITSWSTYRTWWAVQNALFGWNKESTHGHGVVVLRLIRRPSNDIIANAACTSRAVLYIPPKPISCLLHSATFFDKTNLSILPINSFLSLNSYRNVFDSTDIFSLEDD